MFVSVSVFVFLFLPLCVSASQATSIFDRVPVLARCHAHPGASASGIVSASVRARVSVSIIVTVSVSVLFLIPVHPVRPSILPCVFVASPYSCPVSIWIHVSFKANFHVPFYILTSEMSDSTSKERNFAIAQKDAI